MGREGNLHIRVPEGAKQRWVEAAGREGLTLSVWAIRSLDREVAARVGRETGRYDLPAEPYVDADRGAGVRG